MAQKIFVNLPVRDLLLTPSYLYVNVPPSGLSLLTTKSAYRMYRKNQIRVEATILTTWHGFLFSDQNMYVRRFTPFGDFNRYRNRTHVSHSVAIERYKMTPFAFYEVYYDFQGGLGRTEAGVSQPWTCPLQGISSFNLPTFGRMINTCVRSVFWERRCSSVPTSCSIRARSVGLVNQPKTGKKRSNFWAARHGEVMKRSPRKVHW